MLLPQWGGAFSNERDEKMDDQAREDWLALRKQAGLEIDANTAEVMWTYAQTIDPYGVFPELPEECQQVGREYFARAPGSEVRVCFGDLPAATRDALWDKHKSMLSFPAGLCPDQAERFWEEILASPETSASSCNSNSGLTSDDHLLGGPIG